MSDEAPTPRQLSPDVAVWPVVRPVLLAFAAAILVLSIIAVSFWYALGFLPTNMSRPGSSDFPAPSLQVDPAIDLRRANERGLKALGEEAQLPIEDAMRILLSRRDPYAPLLSESAVPDSAGLRAMRAQSASPTGGDGAIGFDAGARTDAMAPETQRRPQPDLPGLGGEQVRVPPSELEGTPNYTPLPDTNAGVER